MLELNCLSTNSCQFDIFGFPIETMPVDTKTKLLGVKFPDQVLLDSKTLYDDYTKFKVLAESLITCYDDFTDEDKVNQVLRWMGPDCMLRHKQNVWADPADAKSLTKLWDFFDRLCLRTEGTSSSWNAARVKLKFLKQKPDEPVHQFYARIRELVSECEFTDEEKKIWEAATLKYGLTEGEVIKQVYTLDKTATVEAILQKAYDAEMQMLHIREVKRVQKEYLGSSSSVSETTKGGKGKGKGYGKGSSNPRKDHKSSGKGDGQKQSCNRCGRFHTNRCPALDKICDFCKIKGHYAKVCRKKLAKQSSKDTREHKSKHKSAREMRGHESSDSSAYETDEIFISEVTTRTPKSILVDEYQGETHDTDACFSTSLVSDTKFNNCPSQDNGAILLYDVTRALTPKLSEVSARNSTTEQIDHTDLKVVEETTFFKKVPKHVHSVTFDDRDTKEQDIAFGIIRILVDDKKEIRLKGKIDTGAQINIMNLKTCKKIFGKDYQKFLRGSKVKLHGYGGKQFKNHGMISTTVKHENVTGRNVQFFITEHGSNLFSLNLCRKLRMVEMKCDNCNDCTDEYDVCEAKSDDYKFNKVDDLTSAFPDVFDGVGCLKDYKVKLQVDPSVVPMQCPPRHFTDDITQRMKKVTDNMQEETVIKRYQGYTEWVSPVQPVIKPTGDIRVCQDFREVNKAILTPK